METSLPFFFFLICIKAGETSARWSQLHRGRWAGLGARGPFGGREKLLHRSAGEPLSTFKRPGETNENRHIADDDDDESIDDDDGGIADDDEGIADELDRVPIVILGPFSRPCASAQNIWIVH